MPQLEPIYERLKADLEAPRILTGQVTHAITSQYSLTTAELASFLVDKLPTLEEYEVDLLFSPQYTPTSDNRLVYIPLLGAEALCAEDVQTLKRRLVDAGLRTTITTLDGQCEATIPVHEVFIERYVNLLKLDQPLPEALHEALQQYVPEASQSEVNLLARGDMWRSEKRQDILIGFLKAFHAGARFSVVKVAFLTDFIRTYRPASLLDMERQLDTLIQSCKTDMEQVSGRGFQDEYLRSLHGRNAKNDDEERDVWAHYKQMMDMAEELKADYQKIAAVAPELLEKARGRKSTV
ncbi:MAG TPA: hypothetical protein V6C99_05605 [Oculatellaceae cyanobacterium]|jgi:hypothetical protein